MKKPPLELRTTPLVLEDVQIKVEDRNGTLYYVLDSENFLRDSRNDLKVLNLLLEQRDIIEAYKTYYQGE